MAIQKWSCGVIPWMDIDMEDEDSVTERFTQRSGKGAEKLNAQAEVVRAQGAAEAIKIENGSLTPTYIQYLWVRQQNSSANKVIYIPTEAGLPILEAKGE